MPAGPEWVKLWPTSTSLEDLIDPFKTNCQAFIAGLEAHAASVAISATYRPPERCYLMHWACMIAKAKQDPASVPPMVGVDIQWDFGTPEATIAACSAMMKAFGIVYPAALVSRHSQRRAIDMTISNAPYQGEELYAMGARYGVIKLRTDTPHWSDDGH